jgi:hypothetical protein
MGTKDEDDMRSAAATMGSKGGFARAETLTPEERSASAKKAAKARWAKAKKKAAKKK